MKSYYVTIEVRLTVKANDEESAKVKIIRELNFIRTDDLHKVTVKGCDFVAITEEPNQ